MISQAKLESSGEVQQTSLFHHADFLKLWTGESISQFGSKIGGVAVSFAAVIALGATPMQMGLLRIWWTAPALLFSLFAGVWVDRLRRRPLMIAADIARTLLLATIPIAAALGVLRIEQLYVVMFINAFGDILFSVGYRAYLPSLVGRDALVRANSMLSATESVAEVAGFGVAGWLVQWLTAPLAILIDAISFLFSALFLALIEKSEDVPERRTRSGVWPEIVEGARCIIDDPRLFAVTLSSTVAAIADGISLTVFLLFVINDLGFKPGALGMIFATGGASALAGAAVAARVADWLGVGWAMAGGIAMSGVAAALAVFAHGVNASSVALLVAQQLIGDSGATVYMVTRTTLVQRISPQAKLGRVVAGMRFLGLAAFLVGLLGGGLIGRTLGLRAAIVIGAMILFAAAAMLAIAGISEDGTHSPQEALP